MELFFDPLDLIPHLSALLVIHFHRLQVGESPMGAVHNRGHHLQIADQFSGGPRRNFFLPLRFEEQRGIIQNALADGGRSSAPGRIQLAGLAHIAVMLGEDGCHALAILQALPRDR